jgi:hypothetical protein
VLSHSNPTETAFSETLSLEQCRQGVRHFIDDGFLLAFFLGFFFLKFLPPLHDFVRSLRVTLGKDVRMAANHFLIYAVGNILHVELACFACNLGVKHDLQKQVT